MRPVISVSNLYKSFKLGRSTTVEVLKGISLELKSGDFTAIMGPSGSGKSTLLNILGCIDRPTSGQYLFEGHDVSRLSQRSRAGIRNRKIGFVFQNFNLLPKFNVFHNIELPLVYANKSRSQRKIIVHSLVKKVGLNERLSHRPSELSGGQKQRVAIARALINNPSIILADEPTGNLDTTTSTEIMEILAKLNREGITILIITHEKHVADYASSTFQLIDGRFV
jgi:putative ABC transport system ATP-binding protein